MSNIANLKKNKLKIFLYYIKEYTEKFARN